MLKFLVISQVIYVLFLMIWFFIWAMSFMLFDAGVTWSNSMIFGTITAYPVVAIVSSIVAWVLYRKGKRRASLYINLIPSLWVISITGLLVIANIGL